MGSSLNCTSLILEDTLNGKPAGMLNLLPAENDAKFQKAKIGLCRRLKYTFEIILVGDGSPFLNGGRQSADTALK